MPQAKPNDDALDPETTPYFLWDYDEYSLTKFLETLHSNDPRLRGWAYGRLLSEATWTDVWRLVSLDEVRETLPLTHFRGKDIWQEMVDGIVAT